MSATAKTQIITVKISVFRTLTNSCFFSDTLLLYLHKFKFLDNSAIYKFAGDSKKRVDKQTKNTH